MNAQTATAIATAIGAIITAITGLVVAIKSNNKANSNHARITTLEDGAPDVKHDV